MWIDQAKMVKSVVLSSVFICTLLPLVHLTEKQTDYRLVYRSEDIIKEQDAEESKLKKYLRAEEIHCEKPRILLHGHVHGEKYEVGSTVYIRCQHGYVLSGPETSTCVIVPNPFKLTVQWDPLINSKCVASESRRGDPGEEMEEDNAIQYIPDPPKVPTYGQAQYGKPPKTVTVNVPEGFPELCALPSKTGRCRGHMARFYFNVNTMECERFIYGGCHGNENRFHTLSECDDFCQKQSNL